MRRFILLALLLMLLAACGRANINIQPAADGTALITVGIPEAEINTIIAAALANSDNPLLREPSVDLQNGQMVISGEHDRRDGSGRVAGTVTLRVAVNNGVIEAEIINVNIEGVDVSDERIANFNQRLSENLGSRALQNNERAQLDSITITDDRLEFQLRVQRANN